MRCILVFCRNSWLNFRMTVDDSMLTVDMLPAPRRLAPKQPAVEAAPAPALAAASRGVGLGDQIAIRSYVLGKTL